eukprot:3463675-Rhodomonas_salina.1
MPEITIDGKYWNSIDSFEKSQPFPVTWTRVKPTRDGGDLHAISSGERQSAVTSWWPNRHCNVLDTWKWVPYKTTSVEPRIGPVDGNNENSFPSAKWYCITLVIPTCPGGSTVKSTGPSLWAGVVQTRRVSL